LNKRKSASYANRLLPKWTLLEEIFPYCTAAIGPYLRVSVCSRACWNDLFLKMHLGLRHYSCRKINMNIPANNNRIKRDFDNGIAKCDANGTHARGQWSELGNGEQDDSKMWRTVYGKEPNWGLKKAKTVEESKKWYEIWIHMFI